MPNNLTPKDLERYAAAYAYDEWRFVPIVNAIDLIEADAYLIRFDRPGVKRGLIECKCHAPDLKELSNLRGDAFGLDAEESWLFTLNEPAEDAKRWASASHLGVGIRVVGSNCGGPQTLSHRGRAVLRTLRCFAQLKRLVPGRPRARRARDAEPTAVTALRKTQHLVCGSMLTYDTLQRASQLYGVHHNHRFLAEDCAWQERVPDDQGRPPNNKRRAVKNAYMLGGGTYTQTALMVQTLNRLYTLFTLAECAEEKAQGRIRDGDISVPRWPEIAGWLADNDLRPFVAPVMFHFIFVLGGLIPLAHEQAIYADIEDATECPSEKIGDVFQLVNSLYRCMQRQRDDSMEWVVPLTMDRLELRTHKLLPYFLKGIGVQYLREALDIELPDDPVRPWEDKARELEEQCIEAEASS